MRGMGALVLLAALAEVAGAAPRRVVAAKPRLTIVEDFKFHDTRFNEQDYRYFKEAVSAAGWTADVRADESGRTICALAQTTDMLMIVSHGGIASRAGDTYAERALRKIGLGGSSPDEPFFALSGASFDSRLYASEIAQQLKGKQGPRVVVGEACRTGASGAMQQAFGGCYFGYEVPVEIEMALANRMGRNRGGTAFAFVERYTQLEKELGGRGPDAEKLQALRAYAWALNLECVPDASHVPEWIALQKRGFPATAGASPCVAEMLKARQRLSGKPVLYLGDRRRK